MRKVVTWDVLVRGSRVCVRYRKDGDREESRRRRECAVRNRVGGGGVLLHARHCEEVGQAEERGGKMYTELRVSVLSSNVFESVGRDTRIQIKDKMMFQGVRDGSCSVVFGVSNTDGYMTVLLMHGLMAEERGRLP
jgi:hypothetical protein